MEINPSTIISYVALAVSVAVLIKVRRSSRIVERRLNEAHHDHEHRFIESRYNSICDDYRDFVNKGELMDSVLVEKMQSLFDVISLQIKEDTKRKRHFSNEFREVIVIRHEQWRTIQDEIRVMIYPVELKG